MPTPYLSRCSSCVSLPFANFTGNTRYCLFANEKIQFGVGLALILNLAHFYRQFFWLIWCRIISKTGRSFHGQFLLCHFIYECLRMTSHYYNI